MADIESDQVHSYIQAGNDSFSSEIGGPGILLALSLSKMHQKFVLVHALFRDPVRKPCRWFLPKFACFEPSKNWKKVDKNGQNQPKFWKKLKFSTNFENNERTNERTNKGGAMRKSNKSKQQEGEDQHKQPQHRAGVQKSSRSSVTSSIISQAWPWRIQARTPVRSAARDFYAIFCILNGQAWLITQVT